ncbi:MAG: hypothetical protein M1836_000613 [Candelina mexicana]|nr:MAG: hypothetical protein M1836_000613 [Candelina mexicana]
MPAMLDDPTKPIIYRNSGPAPFPTPNNPSLPADIVPRQVTLRDRVTIATLLPFSTPDQVPASLLNYLCDQFGREIEKGDTYPMLEPLPLSSFGPYWFGNFGAVMLLGDLDSAGDIAEALFANNINWGKTCLGSFYIKPNYPGRSSHVCNGGFLVTDAARNRGVGRLMGEGYLEWAPKLGYTYSVFNLVYENNIASCRIWDALGFKRIGRVPRCGNLKSHPNELIDALIYGRDLGPEGEDYVSEERFSKIRFYLKHGKYPNGADRAEKSRLRSAATHYKLIPGEDGTEAGERLMLKDKEVVSDLQRQYDIAQQFHLQHHGGINKTTAAIAEKYHWVRIKETVSLVIRNCVDCKEMAKMPPVRADSTPSKRPNVLLVGQGGVSAAGRVLSLPSSKTQPSDHQIPEDGTPQLPSPSPAQQQSPASIRIHVDQQYETAPIANMQHLQGYSEIPLDPQIMEGVQHHLSQYNHSPYTSVVPNNDPISANHQGHNLFTPQETPQSLANGHSGHHEIHDHSFTPSQEPLAPTNGHPTTHDQNLADYQALLETDTTHLPQRSEAVSIFPLTNTTNNPRAQKAAAAAARVAREAMDQLPNDDIEDGEDPRDREMKRQLLGAGYGVLNSGAEHEGRGYSGL